MTKEEREMDKAPENAGTPEQFLGVLLELTSKLQVTLDRMEEVVSMQRKELDEVHTRLRSIEQKLEIED